MMSFLSCINTKTAMTYKHFTNKLLCVIYLKFSIPLKNHSIAKKLVASFTKPISISSKFSYNCLTVNMAMSKARQDINVANPFSQNRLLKTLLLLFISFPQAAISLTPMVPIPIIEKREK